MTKDNLQVFIEELRQELYSLTDKKGLQDEEVIAKSKQLDQLINSFLMRSFKKPKQMTPIVEK